jgi:hypothetical protein
VRPLYRIAALAAAMLILAALPAAAGASVTQELQASGSVERIATRHYPHYDFVASCDQYSARRFWCSVSGTSGNCYRQGHASVRRAGTRRNWINWVTLRLHRSCF